MTDNHQWAADLNAEDLFILSRVDTKQLVSVGGEGRGQGWAGNIFVDLDTESVLSRCLTDSEVVRVDRPTRVFGPYWAESAVAVGVGDYVAVFGGGTCHLEEGDRVLEVAADAIWELGSVPPQKLLADELERAYTCLDVARLKPCCVEHFFDGLATIAAGALGCELGAANVETPQNVTVLGHTGWSSDDDDEIVLAEIMRVAAVSSQSEPVIVQESRLEPRSRLNLSREIVSQCTIPVQTDEVSATVLVGHAAEAPRGFTRQCEEIAKAISSEAARALRAGIPTTCTDAQHMVRA